MFFFICYRILFFAKKYWIPAVDPLTVEHMEDRAIEHKQEMGRLAELEASNLDLTTVFFVLFAMQYIFAFANKSRFITVGFQWENLGSRILISSSYRKTVEISKNRDFQSL